MKRPIHSILKKGDFSQTKGSKKEKKEGDALEKKNPS